MSRSVVDIPSRPPSPSPVVVHATIDTESEVLEPPETQYHHSCPDGKPNELFSVRAGGRGEEEVIKDMSGHENSKV